MVYNLAVEINTIVAIIWIVAISILSLDVVILIGSKNISSRIFIIFSFITAIWAFSQGLLISLTDNAVCDFIIRSQYILGITIAFGFYFFSRVYPNDKRLQIKVVIASILLVLIFGYFYLFTDYLISGVHQIDSLSRWAWTFGKWNFVFDYSFYTLWTMSLYHLFRSYSSATGRLRTNLGNMFIALLLGIIPPTLANILLPSLGEYRVNWLGPILGAIWVFILAYSIAKYRQMNVRVEVTKVFLIAMVMMSALNIFIDFVFGIYGRIALFIAFLILGYFLFKSLTNEARQKDALTSLNAILAQKVAEQTAEIRKAYELEKHARRELEKLNETKDQFIMITQHHLRGPVARIKDELELLSAGSRGKMTKDTRSSLDNITASHHRSSKIVDDFLNISTLKVGSQILNIENHDLKPVIEDVLDELKLDISKMNLTVHVSRDKNTWPTLPIDRSKMREVLLIVIENAVKYNRENGGIDIESRFDNGSFILEIENTGVGIADSDKAKLFNQHYFRSKDAQAANPIGMGIGLSVARAVMKAHHGDLSIVSGGEGKGARVMIRLPLRK